MNWRIGTFLSVLFVAGAFAIGAGESTTENPDIANIMKQYQADVEPARRKVRIRLENLQKELTRKGDLDGAVAVKTVLETFEKAVAEKPALKGLSSFNGFWTVTYNSGSTRQYAIRQDGRVEIVGQNSVGQISRNGDEWILDFNDGKLERLAIKEVLYVDHFDPKSTYRPEVKARQTGTGEKAKVK